jgi:hypothetical protein
MTNPVHPIFRPILAAIAPDDELPWHPIESAPKNAPVEVLNADGEVDVAELVDSRQCMLASVARGAGECGPGWVSKLVDNLPIDAPMKWRQIRCQDCVSPALPGEDFCRSCLDKAQEAAYERSQEEPCYRGGEWAAAQAAEAEWIRRNLKW